MQLRLLALQEVDSAIAQLSHRRRTLPVHAELERLRVDAARLGAAQVAAETAVSDLEADQARAETDLEPVRERLARNQRRIADGTVPDPKALNSMVEEIEHLKKRIGALEDAELEVMEQLESAMTDRDDLRTQAGSMQGTIDEVTARRDTEVALLDAKVADARHERAGLAPDIPANLMALYDKLAASHGGVGAAELRQGRCTGCQLMVNAADLRDDRGGAARRGHALRGMRPDSHSHTVVGWRSCLLVRSGCPLMCLTTWPEAWPPSASACPFPRSSRRMCWRRPKAPRPGRDSLIMIGPTWS